MATISEWLARERPEESGQRPVPSQVLVSQEIFGADIGGRPEGERSPSNGGVDLWQLKNKLQSQLLGQLNLGREPTATPEVRQALERLFNQIIEEEGILLGRADRARLYELVVAEVLGYGPIEPLLNNDTISEVMVNGPNQVYIERNGLLEETNVRFVDDEHVRRIIDRIISPLGRRCDESSPMVDARLPDGSRVNAVIPPLTLNGPLITIRKFSRTPLTVQDLVGFGTMSLQLANFLGACVQGRLNMIVAGGTGSGKTTFLNVLSGYIPENERIVVIEDAAELQLRQRHVIRLERRPPNIEGHGEISIRQLVINALRMRPDRIIVGESRAGEALDMLQAMNTGHDGSLTTIHANSPRDALSRIETMVLMAGADLPLRAIREQISSALDLVIHMDRLADGSRRITKVSEVLGMEGDTILMQDLFEFKQTGADGPKIVGQHVFTGVRPKFMWKLERRGVNIPAMLFPVGHGL